MRPPLEKHGVADQLEPWRENDFVVVEHGFELIGSNVSNVADFIRGWLKINVGLDEEDIVNCLYVSSALSL